MNLDISRKSIINFSLLCLLSLLFLFQGKGVLAYNNVYRDLVDKGVATYEDGCRAISCFTDVDEKNLTFDELVSELREKGIIGKRWKYKAEKPVTRGIMAYMGCRVLNIKGGLTMRTIDITKRFTRLICSKLGIKGDFGLPDIGISKRYAYLELQNMGLVPTGHKKTFLTGHDLLALMYRIEQYIKSEEKEEEKEKEESEESSE
jgi:hypothetical protein